MKKQYIVIAVIAAAALAYYFLFYKKQTPASLGVSVVGTPVGAAPAGVTSGPSTQVPATATSESQTLLFPANNNPGAPMVSADSINYSWFNQLPAIGKARAFAAYPSMTDLEKNNLANTIAYYFDTGTPATPAVQTFWDAWTTKYHIQDGSY